MTEKRQAAAIIDFLRTIKVSGDIITKVLILLIIAGSLVFMFPREESIDLDNKVGSVWVKEELIAPFSFPIYRDDREYAKDVDSARKAIFPVFERDTEGAARQLDTLAGFFDQLGKAIDLRNRYIRSRNSKQANASSDSAEFHQIASQLEIPVLDNEWKLLARLAATNRLSEMKRQLMALAGEYLRVGVLDTPKAALQKPEIALRRGTQEEIISKVRLYDKSDIVLLLENQMRDYYRSDNNTVSIAYKIGIMHFHPNVRFDQAATEAARAVAIDAVPRMIGFVTEEERIVSKHERITEETKLKLESLLRAQAERREESDRATQLFGIVIHVNVIVMLYAIYLYFFRKSIYSNHRQLTLIGILILTQGFFAYVTRELPVDLPVEYLIFVPVSSMLLAIIFDSRVGFYGTVIIAFLVAGIRGNDYSIALASLVAGAFSVYTVRDMKNRTQIFRSMGFIFLGYALVIAALGMQQFESFGRVSVQLGFGLVNAVVSPVTTYGLLIFFERVFKVTTDLTLVELSHFNHPLLRLLAEKAPGSYHHSMTMASLAEAAATAVGANEVLARVGACFHDVGKLLKPGYFVENQKGSQNQHDKLVPRMSSLIIAAHVKDGMALAREYDIPDEVIDFIPMHHGTTRIEYFYNKALQLAQRSNDETKMDEIKEQDYRYQGPKPQTKETGILMLADAVEATARTLDDPSPQKLEVIIDEVIKKRFAEGQLDECPLTLKDLSKIKTAFLKVLVGIYHTRVKYPSADKTKSSVQENASTILPFEKPLPSNIKQINKE
jgi:putative nucleotidyltransferase with HDIG domain